MVVEDQNVVNRRIPISKMNNMLFNGIQELAIWHVL